MVFTQCTTAIVIIDDDAIEAVEQFSVHVFNITVIPSYVVVIERTYALVTIIDNEGETLLLSLTDHMHLRVIIIFLQMRYLA